MLRIERNKNAYDNFIEFGIPMSITHEYKYAS